MLKTEHYGKERTFRDESENPAASKDPSWDIDEQFKLEKEKQKH